MREWGQNKRDGLIPLVSDSVPDLGPGYCYSCAAHIGKEDSGVESDRRRVGDDRWCPDCSVAVVGMLV